MGSIPIPANIFDLLHNADVAERGDAADLKSAGRKIVWVQVPSLAPSIIVVEVSKRVFQTCSTGSIPV